MKAVIPRARYLPPAALAAIVLGGTLPGQRPPRRPVQPYRYVQGSDSLFSVPRSQDDIHEWRLARANVREGDYVAAVERLHQLLRRGRPGVVPLDRRRYLGLRTAVLETLAALPEAGQKAYEKLVEREAGALRKTAFQNRDPQELEALA